MPELTTPREVALERYKKEIAESDPSDLANELLTLRERVAYYQGAFMSMKAVLDGTLPWSAIGVSGPDALRLLTVQEFHNRLLPHVPPLDLPTTSI